MVVEVPETRYVAVGDGEVAYQVVGDGPVDLLYFYGIGAHIELFWDSPLAPPFLRRLGSFARLILFNRRGSGASDGVSPRSIPTWEDWTEDVTVLDAAGSTQAVLLAVGDAGPIAILFAATHPERVRALVLQTTTARYLQADGYDIGASEQSARLVVDTIRSLWGKPELQAMANPSLADNEEFLRFGARWLRASATPANAAAQFDYILRSLDVREALPLIQAPTLVLHTERNALFPVAHGRYLADHIRGAKFVALPGGDTAITPSTYVVADEVAEFVTGERVTVDADRILTTILITDVVGSTERVAALGDVQWRQLLDRHDRAVREELRRSRGRVVNTTGDGFLVSFDGPARAIRCAQTIISATAAVGLDIRVGLHTGECEVRGDDLGGLAVHGAARVGALALPGEVLVTSTVKDLVVGSGIDFEHRGLHQLKGVPGEWQLFAAS